MNTTLITGGIGSGKSAVCRHLISLGYPVYDCDSRCKALYSKIPGLKDRIEKELSLPFDRLEVIFTDEVRRSQLESIVFPFLLEDIRGWRSVQDCERCFIESATALEKPAFDGIYDDVWIVVADPGIRAVRNPKVLQRAGIQHYDMSKASAVIMNNGSLCELYETIDNLL